MTRSPLVESLLFDVYRSLGRQDAAALARVGAEALALVVDHQAERDARVERVVAAVGSVTTAAERLGVSRVSCYAAMARCRKRRADL